MSLSAQLRPIDDRTFEQLVAEARARIPRYTPEWTDLNDNDLGIAMVQLFAWLAEQQIFRMARVPELNYVKFLEMIGIALRPAEPARSEITLPVKPGFALPAVNIPRRTQIVSRTEDGSGPIVFETERPIYAIEPQLDRVQTGRGAALRDLSPANESADEVFNAFGPSAGEDAALVLGFRSDGPFPDVELDLTFWVNGAGRADSALVCASGASRRLPADIVWETWDGAGWRPLTLLADETLAFTRSGHVRLRGPAAGSIVRSALGAVTEERYWVRARLRSAGYDAAPQLLKIATNTAPALQSQTVEGEILGGTNATLDQVLTFARRPVIAGSALVEIDQGEGFAPWREVPDFFGSGPDDRDFVLDRLTGVMRFGDGTNGAIPIGNPLLPGANAVARLYGVGGGTRGNLPAGEISVLRTPVQGLDNARVGNLFAADGGRDAEALDEAMERGRRQIAAHDRAVTLADHELLARQAGPVARAKALALHHPEFPGVEVPGVTSVVIIPDLPDDPAPVPSATLMRTVCDYLNARRLLTAELYVLAPSYLDIVVSGELVINDDADPAEVLSDALDRLDGYFHPLTGGDAGSGWPFGGDVYHSRIASLLLADGVRRVSDLSITLGRTAYPPCSDAPLPAGALLRSGKHDLRTRYEAPGDG